MNRTYLCIDLNNAENKVMPILSFRHWNIMKCPKNIGITNYIKP